MMMRQEFRRLGNKLFLSFNVISFNGLLFREYVAFFLDGGARDDVHVQSFLSKCAMCDLSYDVIGKVETAEQDIK